MKRFLSLVLTTLFFTVAAISQSLPQDWKNENSGRPINMLVVGDSILWGQGLKPEHKSWYQAKLWLERTAGRKVIERIAAHSGAAIEAGSTNDRLTAGNPEVNDALPTINDQFDTALKSYGDASKVDLVLLSGR